MVLIYPGSPVVRPRANAINYHRHSLAAGGGAGHHIFQQHNDNNNNNNVPSPRRLSNNDNDDNNTSLNGDVMSKNEGGEGEGQAGGEIILLHPHQPLALKSSPSFISQEVSKLADGFKLLTLNSDIDSSSSISDNSDGNGSGSESRSENVDYDDMLLKLQKNDTKIHAMHDRLKGLQNCQEVLPASSSPSRRDQNPHHDHHHQEDASQPTPRALSDWLDTIDHSNPANVENRVSNVIGEAGITGTGRKDNSSNRDKIYPHDLASNDNTSQSSANGDGRSGDVDEKKTDSSDESDSSVAKPTIFSPNYRNSTPLPNPIRTRTCEEAEPEPPSPQFIDLLQEAGLMVCLPRRGDDPENQQYALTCPLEDLFDNYEAWVTEQWRIYYERKGYVRLSDELRGHGYNEGKE